MTNKLTLKIFLTICWVIPFINALTVLIMIGSAFLIPEKIAFLIFIISLVITVGIVPWFLIAYLLNSKKFGVGWHWFFALLAPLLAIILWDIIIDSSNDSKLLAEGLRTACSMPASETNFELRSMLFNCSLTAWLTFTKLNLLHTLTIGIMLIAPTWIYRRLKNYN